MTTSTSTSSDAGLVTPGGYVLPPGTPPGELAFLVGIAANESGFDYQRDQGSPAGSIGTYGGGAEEGFGEYQFTGPSSSQVQQAEAAGWAPAAQDRIAASMAQGYFEQAKQGGASDANAWAAATEAWYGPGTITPDGWNGPAPSITGNDVLADPTAPSAADWANVKAALQGKPNLPSAFVYGPGNSGLSAAQVGQELTSHHPVTVPASTSSSTTATLDSWEPFPGGLWDPANWAPAAGSAIVGGVANSVGSEVSSALGSAVSSLSSSLGPTLLKVGLYVVGAVAGASLVVLGIRDLGGRRERDKPDAGQLTELAPLLAA